MKKNRESCTNPHRNGYNGCLENGYTEMIVKECDTFKIQIKMVQENLCECVYVFFLHWHKVLIVFPYGGHFAQQKVFVCREKTGYQGCLQNRCLH